MRINDAMLLKTSYAGQWFLLVVDGESVQSFPILSSALISCACEDYFVYETTKIALEPREGLGGIEPFSERLRSKSLLSVDFEDEVSVGCCDIKPIDELGHDRGQHNLFALTADAREKPWRERFMIVKMT
jgi:hypothetical protein